MASLILPQQQIESLRGNGGDFEWPAGAYEGTFEHFEIRDLPATSDGRPFAGYATIDGTRLSIHLGNLTPLEGQGDVGNRKYFLDLTIGDGEHSLTNVDVTAKDVDYWQLQKSAKLIGNLAMALGATKVTEDGQVEVEESFLDDLMSGAYAGQKIGFVIYNRKAKNGKLYPDIETFVVA